MADIKKIKIDSTEYNVADISARAGITTLSGRCTKIENSVDTINNTSLPAKEDKGKITIGGVQYTITTDESLIGNSAYMVFVLE